MIIYNLVSALCLASLVGIVVWMIVSYKKLAVREEKIKFVRSFKEGRCAIVYICAIPVYLMGHIYSGEIFEAPFLMLNELVDLLVLKYDFGTLSALMAQSSLYSVTVYCLFVLVACNVFMFALSLFGQKVEYRVKNAEMRRTKENRLYILGSNAGNENIYRSATNVKKLLVDDLTKEKADEYFLEGINYRSETDYTGVCEEIIDGVGAENQDVTVIINTGDDDKNIKICQSFISLLKKKKETGTLSDTLMKDLHIYAFGDPRYETIYCDAVSSAYGCLHYINKYQCIAMDFIDKYPFSNFLVQEQVDYSTSLIKCDAGINVFMIGFGKTNRQIFLTSVANNQFVTVGASGKIGLKKVNYFIYDKEEAENDKNLNHNYYRFEREMIDTDKSKYLDFPQAPANVVTKKLNVNDYGFYDSVRKRLTENGKDANFIVIAFGTDLENIDMAQKFVEKRREWGVKNLVIFVKARKKQKMQTLIEDENCYFIANENEVVYDYEKIRGDKLFKMAQMRNFVYDLEYEIAHNNAVVTDGFVKEIAEKSFKNWYLEKNQLERESSLYCCLSLRSKLNLMGLDYKQELKEGEKALTEEEYLSRYAGDDLPDYAKYATRADGKKIVGYTLDFKESRRKTMAIHEHLRWNSFMISKGVVPATKEQIQNDYVVKENGKKKYTNGKDYKIRRHGCLTTWDGLEEYRFIVAKRNAMINGKDTADELKEADVIKYDYQLLDDAYWLLDRFGFKIVELKR